MGRLFSTGLTVLLILAGWVATAATAARFGSFATLMIVAPPAGILDRLPRDISLAGGLPHVLVLRADRDDFAQVLYEAGARLVLPARAGGCLAVLRASGE